MWLNSSVFFTDNMRVGSLVGGIILLVFGLMTYTFFQNQINESQTFMGQLGRAISSEQQAAYNMYQMFSLIGVVMSVIGVGLLIHGAVAKSKGKSQSSEVDSLSASRNIPEYAMRENKIFCRYCGKLRPVSGSFCSECGKSSESTSTIPKKCTYCSATMTQDSEFCANCGRKF